MNALERIRETRLESILRRHDAELEAVERKTLADLHRAGFRYRTLSTARQQLTARQTLARLRAEMSSDEYVEEMKR